MLARKNSAGPTSAVRSWLLGAASAAVACALAGRAQLNTKPVPLPAAAGIVRHVEASGPVIRLQAPCSGIACVRLRPVKDYEAAFGGAAAKEVAEPPGPSSLQSAEPALMFTRDA